MGNTICLLNDSFPPLIDGVANTVMNYASELNRSGRNAVVLTPDVPQADDSAFPYPVYRYPSISTDKFRGYPAGIPFSPEAAEKIRRADIQLFHSHCPVMSTFMARQLRQVAHAPIVFTYHTKFDVDIAEIVKNSHLESACKKILCSNISACDEVWAVSQGAGENLRALGYQGDYIVMPNGVDMPLGKASPERIAQATQGYDLPKDVPVYLFVGRMLWYKGIRVILDGLALLRREGKPFRMVFIGDGADLGQIQTYAQSCDLASRCIFTGAIRDRELLRCWYSRADLFLFPSTYDTNGLVVREAAACNVASVLIRGSCAAEGVTDGENGFLIDQTGADMARCLSALSTDRMHRAGRQAAQELYISWSTAVDRAMERYAVVMERYPRGLTTSRTNAAEGILKINGELMEALGRLTAFYRKNNE